MVWKPLFVSFGQTRTQHRGAVQTQNGIHRSVVDEMGHQLMGAVLGLAQAGLLVGDVHEVIDVGVIGGKMSPGDAKRCVASADGQIHQCDHNSYLRLNNKSVFLMSGRSVFAGHLKNAFFHYIPIPQKRQGQTAPAPAKFYLPNLGMLRKRSAFSCL